MPAQVWHHRVHGLSGLLHHTLQVKEFHYLPPSLGGTYDQRNPRCIHWSRGLIAWAILQDIVWQL